MPNQRRVNVALQLNLAFAFAGGLLVLWSYLREPSEPGSAAFLGFSYLRLTLLLSVLFLLLAIGLLLFGSFRNSRQAQAFQDFLIRLANQKGALWVLMLWLTLSYGLLFLSDQQLGDLASYRGRLLPFLLWAAVLAIQFGFFVIYLRGTTPGVFRGHQTVLIGSLVVLSLFGLVLLIIRLTGIGLTPDEVYWQGPGVPILLPQILLAAFAGILFYLFMERTPPAKSTRVDLLIFLGLWGAASLIWLNQPAELTHFALEPTPPNYQIYPYSDSLLYDHTAREYLIGKPIPSGFWVKPLYSFFLAALHVFAGGNYTFLISLQTIFLAIIPALAYLLMVRLDSRPAGLIVGLLLILRERNALALSNVIQVSHVKLLLSDVFTMGFMVLLLWLFFHWVEKPGERRVTPMVLGGVLSLLVLSRGHPILLLPILLCAVCLVPVPRFRLRWEALALIFLGFLIPLLPWFWRNYELTQKLILQYPTYPYSAQLSKAYSFDPSVFDPQGLPLRYPGESDFAYYERMQRQTFGFILEHPNEVARFISAHYFHNLIFSYIYLPYSFRIEEINEYVKREPFWGGWRGEISPSGRVLLFINLSLVALGFGYLWKKYKYLAFVPLLLGVGYIGSVSIGRISGWRFILPADWITLIYYALGIIQFYYLLRSFTNREANPAPQEYRAPEIVHPLKRLPLTGFILFFLAIGLALTKGQELFSQRYPVKSALQLKEEYVRVTNTMPSSLSNSQLDDFLKTDSAVIVYGQARNPSFLVADKEGFNDSWPVYYFWPSYRPKPFARVIFNLSGPKSAGIILPLESAPASFPDGSDVIVIGCLAESGEINALAVLLQGASPIHYASEPFPTPACPLSEPASGGADNVYRGN